MKTFSIQTLGCRVNHYESQQIAQLLRAKGLTETDITQAELRVVHTCSITTHAAGQSRQSARRAVRLPLMQLSPRTQPANISNCADPVLAEVTSTNPGDGSTASTPLKVRVLVTGCWATSNPEAALTLPGIDAVLGHHDDMAKQLDHLIELWQIQDNGLGANVQPPALDSQPSDHVARLTRFVAPSPGPMHDERDIWMMQAGAPADQRNAHIKPSRALQVNQNFVAFPSNVRAYSDAVGAASLPLLDARQTDRQRALLKVQDGCDAHCTYCIIPQLRARPWSKPIEAVVQEAKALVDAGHGEIVLTGIFLGAYGQSTALRRRQNREGTESLARLIDTLCRKVVGLRRLRLSSLEPGDLNEDLLAVLRSHPQIMPHFHLPLQSGSDLILRRMNRQYTRGDYLDMIERANNVFDRPAVTTDIVVGFPGEDDAEFEETYDVARQSGFIHIHAFPYSPRPGTAAARWTDQFIHGPIVGQRIERLGALAEQQSLSFRRQFLGETVQVIVERNSHFPPGREVNRAGQDPAAARHGRCQRYFDVWFDDRDALAGNERTVRITQVTPTRTFGSKC